METRQEDLTITQTDSQAVTSTRKPLSASETYQSEKTEFTKSYILSLYEKIKYPPNKNPQDYWERQGFSGESYAIRYYLDGIINSKGELKAWDEISEELIEQIMLARFFAEINCGNIELVKKFPEKYFKKEDKSGWLGIHHAAGTGQTRLVEYFLEKQPELVTVTSRNPVKSLLDFALDNGSSGMLALLISKRAKIQESSLQTALERPDKEKTMIVLLNNYTFSQQTLDEVLPKAVQIHGALDLVKKLVKAGANIHIRDEKNNTLLHKAHSSKNNKQIIAFLLEKGVNPCIRNNDNKTAIDAGSTYMFESSINGNVLILLAQKIREHFKIADNRIFPLIDFEFISIKNDYDCFYCNISFSNNKTQVIEVRDAKNCKSQHAIEQQIIKEISKTYPADLANAYELLTKPMEADVLPEFANVSLETKTLNNWTLLMWAVHLNNTNLTNYLVKSGAVIDQLFLKQNPDKIIPLLTSGAAFAYDLHNDAIETSSIYFIIFILKEIRKKFNINVSHPLPVMSLFTFEYTAGEKFELLFNNKLIATIMVDEYSIYNMGDLRDLDFEKILNGGGYAFSTEVTCIKTIVNEKLSAIINSAPEEVIAAFSSAYRKYSNLGSISLFQTRTPKNIDASNWHEQLFIFLNEENKGTNLNSLKYLMVSSLLGITAGNACESELYIDALKDILKSMLPPKNFSANIVDDDTTEEDNDSSYEL